MGRTATALAAGERHTCALLDDGSAVCWGANDVGQFGDGTNTGQNVPTQTSGFGGGRVAVPLPQGTITPAPCLPTATFPAGVQMIWVS